MPYTASGIQINSRFVQNAGLPLDNRYTCASASQRATIPAGVLYSGLQVWLEDVQQLTIWNGSAWIVLSAPPSAGITSLNGLTDANQTFSTGTTGINFNISSSGTVHTFNIPDASATARGLITNGAQTIAGNKTFSGLILGANGSNSSPSFSFSGDTNTGIYNIGSDIIGVATNGAERLRINSTGNLAFNSTNTTERFHVSNVSVGDTSAAVIALFTGLGNSHVVIQSASNTANRRPEILIRRSRGTVDSPTAVSLNDTIGGIGCQGYSGTSYINSALVEAYVDGTVTSTEVPMRLSFTTGTNSSTRAERFTVKFNGQIGVNNTSPNTSSQFQIDSTTRGFLAPRMTTVQRDAIGTPATGLFVYNTTDNAFNFYNGSIWTTFGGGSGITSLNALTGSTQTFATGTSGSDFAISSTGTTHTFNLPDASASARGLVNTGTQSFSGSKSFNDNFYISDDDAPVSGGGTRLMWMPTKGAFRAGSVDNNEWNETNIGLFSIALGYNCRATASGSFAFGEGALASADLAIAFTGSTSSGGSAVAFNNSIASGVNSFACNASFASANAAIAFSEGISTGTHSFSIGNSSIASGSYSFAKGFGVLSRDYCSTSIGQFNEDATNDPTVFSTANVALGIGNGTSSGDRRNVFKITFLGQAYINNTGASITQTASSILDLRSTTLGFLAPRMTTTQRNAIATPATGLQIYNTTNSQYESHDGTRWRSIGANVTNDDISQEVFRLESIDTGNNPFVSYVQGKVTTTNATTTTLKTFPTVSDTTYGISVRVLARRTGGTAGTDGDSALYERIACFRNIAGTVTQVASTTAPVTQESVSAYNVTFDISGTNIRLRVIGVADTNITWHLVKAEVSSLSN